MRAVSGRVIWLTGASSGIGESLAIELAKRGAVLAITARRGDLLKKLETVITQDGGRCCSYEGDVQDLKRMQDVASQIESSLGPVDTLIANAGTHIFTQPERFNSTEYLNLMDLNYGGMLRCIESVLPSMISRGSGHIVGVASVAGYRGLPRAAAYCASKSAMITFMESLRFHLRRKGIKVTTVNPGFVKTPLTDKNDFNMPFLTSPDVAATKIVNGIEREKLVITFPFPFAQFMSLARIIPFTWYDKIIDKLWR